MKVYQIIAYGNNVAIYDDLLLHKIYTVTLIDVINTDLILKFHVIMFFFVVITGVCGIHVLI